MPREEVFVSLIMRLFVSREEVFASLIIRLIVREEVFLSDIKLLIRNRGTILLVYFVHKPKKSSHEQNVQNIVFIRNLENASLIPYFLVL